MRSEQELKRKPRPPLMERGKSGVQAQPHQDPCLLGSEPHCTGRPAGKGRTKDFSGQCWLQTQLCHLLCRTDM